MVNWEYPKEFMMIILFMNYCMSIISFKIDRLFMVFLLQLPEAGESVHESDGQADG